jgi:predicted RNase H-like HicB family nuclease
MAKEYIALFEYEDDEVGFDVVFPDLPGCYSSGKDYDDAVLMAHEAVALYAEDNEQMPEPRSLEQIKNEWEDWETWEKDYQFLVGKVSLYPLKMSSQRFNVIMPSNLVSRIDKVARNRSAFLTRAAEYLLEQGSEQKASKG